MIDMEVELNAEQEQARSAREWSDPLPIPSALQPVAAFQPAMLPESLRAWISDIAERMQCPPDFPAVGAMVALSSVIGRKRIIAPKRYDDWTVVPNLWGCVVGRPGIMKSPALNQIMVPLDRLAISAAEDHQDAIREYAVGQKLAKLTAKADEAEAEKLIKAKKLYEAEAVLKRGMGADDAKEPAMRRYKTTDPSVEALGEILEANPHGTLVYRDELSGLLRSLDREGQESARSFYLQGYDGNQGWTCDRIGRGKYRHIDAVCISMLGGIQPGKIQGYIRDAIRGGAGDDGLLQRFGLLIWPDITGAWRNVDRWPDTQAKNSAFAVFEGLDDLEPDQDGNPIVIKFSPKAQALFDDWRGQFEPMLRAGDLLPALESHLAKYRKLVPALALVCGLADGENEAISHASLLRALGWAQYLRTHAERAYHAGQSMATEGAKALLAKIRAGALADGFRARDVYLKGWAHVSDPEATKEALTLLCDLGYIKGTNSEPDPSGGRPTTVYSINPKITGGES